MMTIKAEKITCQMCQKVNWDMTIIADDLARAFFYCEFCNQKSPTFHSVYFFDKLGDATPERAW